MLKISFSAIFPCRLLYFGLIGLLCVGSFDLAAQGVTITVQNTSPICANTVLVIESAIPDTCGTPVAYQWQVWSEVAWITVDNQNPTAHILEATPEDIGLGNEGRIRLLVSCSGSTTPSLSSNIVTLNIIAPPVAPQVMQMPANPICPGDQVTLSASGNDGDTFVWSTGDTTSSITVTPNMTTTYTVQSVNECGDSNKTIMVTVTQPPTAITSIKADPEQPCEGQRTELSATGGQNGNVKWYSGPDGTGQALGTDPNLDVTEAVDGTIYYARRENNCENSEDLSFTLETQPSPIAIIEDAPEALCINTDYIFVVGGTNETDVEYKWSFPEGAPANHNSDTPISVSYASSGTKTVTLDVSNSACTTSTEVNFQVLERPTLSVNGEIVNTSTQLMLELPEKIRSNLTLSSNFSDATFTWAFEPVGTGLSNAQRTGSGAAISEQWSLVSGVEEAELVCTVTVTSGDCSETYVFSLLIKKLLFVPNIITPNGDGFNDCWHIELLKTPLIEASELNIELYTRSGRCVRGCSEAFTVADAMEWCGEGCAAGAYFYRITGPGGFETRGSLTLVK